MTQSIQKDKNNFIYPHSRYYGQGKPEYVVFNANLQEFSCKVSYISALESSGKLSPQEAYEQIKGLWKELKRSKHELGIGSNIAP